MRKTIDDLFLRHPREVGEGYFEHLGTASTYGFRLMVAAGAAFAHALVPGVMKTAASDRVCAMADELRGRKQSALETRCAEQGAYDPGL
ncbi:DUF6356 family protein [Brevundimonas balnearis]|uniref:DUF6356 family protein n=1 Tax=Brevundimonas balnearis TaxID=1572858 RepID=A0ABV6R3B0_9CAUL